MVNGEIYFEPGVYSTLRDRPKVLESALDLIRATSGVAHVYRNDALDSRASAGDTLAHAAKLSYFEERIGDLIMILKPHWIPGGLAATHGSPYDYDTKVPVVLFGAGVSPGTHLTPFTLADIAPTLARLAGLSMPETDEGILEEALTLDSRP
jgi:predicted AlkP superfamily pyrophosphatase or phosphodiesterase